ncbi:MAG: hypothetical protein HC910_22020 [Spirulinaceae cyanobacterium SM2_1_0]|nr:hypothetical protein [Spirulinaceae cyanobacterium SM2_1_0]
MTPASRELDDDHTLRRQATGSCPLCQRHTRLTFHHLIPKALHNRNRYRKNYTREELQLGINIYRRCHSGLHALHDEKTLGQELNTLEQLCNDPAIRKHSAWVAKQCD